MRRSGLACVALGLAVMGASGAIFLTGSSKDRPTVSPVSSRNSTTSMPPLPGRIAIGSSQLREAYAAGLIDQPVKSLLDVPRRMAYGDFVWNDTGVPSGRVWVRVDLSSQILSVFRAGHEIGTAVILYGTDGLPTPTGKFPILAKMKDHRSVTYGDAPMPYTLRLTDDGVSIHGSNVRWGFATHGCVGVPRDFAAKMFDVVSKGDEVLIVSESNGKHRA